jgi:hypothetical protein
MLRAFPPARRGEMLMVAEGAPLQCLVVSVMRDAQSAVVQAPELSGP